MPMLTGPQIKPFQQALLSAFDRHSLTLMLSTELNKKFEQLVKEADFDYQVFQLIDRANREGWAYKLLLVAASYNPGNPDLQAYAASLNLAAGARPPPPRLSKASSRRTTATSTPPSSGHARAGSKPPSAASRSTVAQPAPASSSAPAPC